MATVGQLRAALDGLPDDATLVVTDEGEYKQPCTVYLHQHGLSAWQVELAGY